MESGQWELGAKQCAPGAKRFDIATTTRVVDGDACVLARLEQQLLRALLARGIHIVADRRAKSGGIRGCPNFCVNGSDFN